MKTTNLRDFATAADAIFWAFVTDARCAGHEHDAAHFAATRAFGIDNWAELSPRSREAFDWVFGRESRLPGWATRDVRATERVEDRIYARQEEDV